MGLVTAVTKALKGARIGGDLVELGLDVWTIKEMFSGYSPEIESLGEERLRTGILVNILNDEVAILESDINSIADHLDALLDMSINHSDLVDIERQHVRKLGELSNELSNIAPRFYKDLIQETVSSSGSSTLSAEGIQSNLGDLRDGLSLDEADPIVNYFFLSLGSFFNAYALLDDLHEIKTKGFSNEWNRQRRNAVSSIDVKKSGNLNRLKNYATKGAVDFKNEIKKRVPDSIYWRYNNTELTTRSATKSVGRIALSGAAIFFSIHSIIKKAKREEEIKNGLKKNIALDKKTINNAIEFADGTSTDNEDIKNNLGILFNNKKILPEDRDASLRKLGLLKIKDQFNREILNLAPAELDQSFYDKRRVINEALEGIDITTCDVNSLDKKLTVELNKPHRPEKRKEKANGSVSILRQYCNEVKQLSLSEYTPESITQIERELGITSENSDLGILYSINAVYSELICTLGSDPLEKSFSEGDSEKFIRSDRLKDLETAHEAFLGYAEKAVNLNQSVDERVKSLNKIKENFNDNVVAKITETISVLKCAIDDHNVFKAIHGEAESLINRKINSCQLISSVDKKLVFDELWGTENSSGQLDVYSNQKFFSSPEIVNNAIQIALNELIEKNEEYQKIPEQIARKKIANEAKIINSFAQDFGFPITSEMLDKKSREIHAELICELSPPEDSAKTCLQDEEQSTKGTYFFPAEYVFPVRYNSAQKIRERLAERLLY